MNNSMLPQRRPLQFDLWTLFWWTTVISLVVGSVAWYGRFAAHVQRCAGHSLSPARSRPGSALATLTLALAPTGWANGELLVSTSLVGDQLSGTPFPSLT